MAPGAATKPVLHPIQTSRSCTFPSEIRSASLSAVSSIKQEDLASTPITPPLAYTEFLKALTPVFTSPVSPGTSFKYPLEKYPAIASISQPTTATDTNFSNCELKSAAISPKMSAPPKSPAVKSPNATHSAKTANGRRRMRLPPVKTSFKSFSPTTNSPIPTSATSLRSPFSPADWKLRYIETPRSASGKPVSVKQVVTRTVTYKRTPLEPAPKGKRRKVADS